MNEKVLIYMQSSELVPVGGPRGYVYNLRQELLKRNTKEICFIETEREIINKYKNKIESMQEGRLKRILVVVKSIIKHYLILYGRQHRSLVDLSEYAMVHFHSTLDMYNVRDSLKTYRGKVILTTHSPVLLSKEIYQSRSSFEKKYFGFIYNKLIRIDEYAFQRADYFVFPCPEAEEPYYHSWSAYAKIRQERSKDYRYVLTGISKCEAKRAKSEVREQYHIPQDAFVISYVGRHNRDKGYDIMQSIGLAALENENVYVLVAGKEKPLQAPKHSRWIEVGWTNDPHSLIAASDVFVLPNRETYFDLVMLEVLSLGQIVLASRTGGNKFFEKQQCDGVILFETEREAVDILKELMKANESEKKKRGSDSLELYNKFFTLDKFADQYIKLYSDLLKE